MKFFKNLLSKWIILSLFFSLTLCLDQLHDPWTFFKKQSVFGSNVHLRTLGAAVVFGGVVDSIGPVVEPVISNEKIMTSQFWIYQIFKLIFIVALSDAAFFQESSW